MRPPSSPTDTPANNPNGVQRSHIRAKYWTRVRSIRSRRRDGARSAQPSSRSDNAGLATRSASSVCGAPSTLASDRRMRSVVSSASSNDDRSCAPPLHFAKSAIGNSGVRSTKNPDGRYRPTGAVVTSLVPVHRLAQRPPFSNLANDQAPAASGSAQDKSSNRSHLGAVSVTAHNNTNATPADPLRSELSDTQPCRCSPISPHIK